MTRHDGRRWASDITPRGALLIGMLAALTIAAAVTVRSVNANDLADDRETHTATVSTAIERRVAAYVEVLHGVRGLLAAADDVDHTVFADYARALDPTERFSGAQVIGTALAVSHDDVDDFAARLEDDVATAGDGYPDFEIHPATDLDLLLPISYVFPVEGNEAAYGLDFMSEENRRTAAERSRDTGHPAATAPVTLVQETGTQRAFLVMLAFYDDPAARTGDVAMRRESFAGTVYAAFRMGDLIEGVFDIGENDSIEVYDVGPSSRPADLTAINAETVMYSTGSELLAPTAGAGSDELTTIDVAGRRWAVFVSTMKVGTPLSSSFPWFVLIGGMLLLGLFTIVMVATTRAQRANRAKSEFLSRMSHELRTPLNAVIGFAQVLRLGDLDEGQSEGVEQIETAGKHLLGLINEVLDISRIEIGQLKLSVEPVGLDEVFTEVSNLLAPMATQAGLTIEFCSEHADIVVNADRQRLMQVLINLGSNAVKYNRPDGGVRVHAEPRDTGRVRITVTDTGRGIPSGQRHRLFSPFDRLDAEMSGVEGAGLGLVLTRMLTQAMGGEIGVESTVGVGTTFWVEFDAAMTPLVHAAEAGSTEPRANSTHRSGRVLYIEDNPANASLMRAIFQQRPGASLVIAEAGAEGVALATETAFDLVLLDLNLPRSSGADILTTLKAIRPDVHLPVVMVSADATPATLERLLALGADGYLTKPVDVAELLALCDEHLDKVRPLVGTVS